MRPEKLLTAIVAHQRDKLFDMDFISKELMNRGRTKEEIEMAIKLACCITFFDSVLFENPINISFSPRSHKNKFYDFFAGYCNPLEPKNKIEEYIVSVEKLPEKIKEYSRYFVSFDKNNKSFLFSQTEEEFLITVAAHEVRHRLQFNNRVKLFNKDKKYRKPISNFVRFTSMAHEHESKGKPKKYIKERLSKYEFDTKVIIDYFFASKLRKGRRPKELFKALEMQG